MAKVRLVIAAVTSIMAASFLDRGYGYGVAGSIVIFLTGPYIAVDSRDLIATNVAGLFAVMGAIAILPLNAFDKAGTAVFVMLAALVSTLLGRVLEASNRRAFTLELEQHRDARTDSLTGLANRRAMQERGRIELKLARRTGTAVSVILCDFDFFKQINDKYGHETGDMALVKAAAVLRAALRESDALGRWGGEEFIAVLPATAEAHDVAERVRVAIANTKFNELAEPQTISLGVASSQGLDDPALEWDLLIKEADRRLYRAKHEGRNRVVSK
jgi:diguanylate cyclase (GGDEF)-like protein